MRFSSASALLSLPLLAVADVPNYQAQFQDGLQNFLGSYAKFIPNPNIHDPVGAAEAKAGSLKMDILTIDNWRDTLYGPVKQGSTKPVEWYVLITGGNKTCFGHCDRIQEMFNQTSAKFAVLPNGPRTAYLNCEQQPVLCNMWSAPAGVIWAFEMLPEPSPVQVWTRRLNMTTVTSDDIMELHKEGIQKTGTLKDGMFHPINGALAQNGIAVPVGYAIWAFGLVPSYVFMIMVSVLSRRFMPRPSGGAGGPGAPGGAPAPAQ